MDVVKKAELNRIRYSCVICGLRTAVKLWGEKGMSDEEFVLFENSCRMLIMNRKHDIYRICCGFDCVHEAQDIIKAEKMEHERKTRCARDGCHHTIEKHVYGPCIGYKCKCLGFLSYEALLEHQKEQREKAEKLINERDTKIQ